MHAVRNLYSRQGSTARKRAVTQSSDRIRNLYGRQGRTIRKRAFPHRADTFRNPDGLNPAAAGKRVTADIGNSVHHINAGNIVVFPWSGTGGCIIQHGAVPVKIQGVHVHNPIYLVAAAAEKDARGLNRLPVEYKAGEHVAGLEGVVADQGHAVRKGYAGQISVSAEGIPADGSYTLFNDHRLDTLLFCLPCFCASVFKILHAAVSADGQHTGGADFPVQVSPGASGNQVVPHGNPAAQIRLHGAGLVQCVLETVYFDPDQGRIQIHDALRDHELSTVARVRDDHSFGAEPAIG